MAESSKYLIEMEKITARVDNAGGDECPTCYVLRVICIRRVT